VETVADAAKSAADGAFNEGLSSNCLLAQLTSCRLNRKIQTTSLSTASQKATQSMSIQKPWLTNKDPSTVGLIQAPLACHKHGEVSPTPAPHQRHPKRTMGVRLPIRRSVNPSISFIPDLSQPMSKKVS